MIQLLIFFILLNIFYLLLLSDIYTKMVIIIEIIMKFYFYHQINLLVLKLNPNLKSKNIIKILKETKILIFHIKLIFETFNKNF